jgi:hypothetical protein
MIKRKSFQPTPQLQAEEEDETPRKYRDLSSQPSHSLSKPDEQLQSPVHSLILCLMLMICLMQCHVTLM